jgi:hypothetical protein
MGFAFLCGIVTVPLLKPVLRPVARTVVKGGLVASQYLHNLAQEAREDLQDLTAEAEAEIASKSSSKKTAGTSHSAHKPS